MMSRAFTLFLFLLIGTPLCFPGGSFSATDAQAKTKPTVPTAIDLPAMWRGGPSHPGVFEGDGPTAFHGLQWRLQTGGAVYSSPVIYDGVVYIGSNDGFLYAIDEVDGDVLWKFDAQSTISSSPAITTTAVLFAARDGRLYSLSRKTGKLIWSLPTGLELPLAWGHESGDFILSSPTIVADQVLFGSGDGFLYCATLKAGRVLWKFKTGGRVRSTPAYADGSAFVGSQDGRIYCVDFKTGIQKWRYDTEGVGFDSSKFGFDRKTIQSSPSVANGVVFVGARDGFLYALAADDGKLRWRFDHEVSWVNSSAALVGNTVYATSSDMRFVQSVDAQTGKENWRLKTEGVVWSSPAVSGSMIYVGDGAGALYAIDRTTGKELWRYNCINRIHSSPAVNRGRLYFGSENGGVYALNVSSGVELKRAVYWDAGFTKESSVRGSTMMRDFFKDRGYEVLDAKALTSFLNARINDRGASVVVFAIDRLPDDCVAETTGVALFRRYLDAGGKAVWPGIPPLLWPLDTKLDSRKLTDINRAGTEKLLGVGQQKGNFDQITARATAEGVHWGLAGWWLSNWSADPSNDLKILARDEQGLAAAWVRSYGGPEGTGFVRIPVTATPAGAPSNLPALQIAAEYFPVK